MLEPAASATSSNLSGNSAMMSRVWVPMEPVEPSREKRCAQQPWKGTALHPMGAQHSGTRRRCQAGAANWPRQTSARTLGVSRGMTSGGTTRAGHAGGTCASALACTTRRAWRPTMPLGLAVFPACLPTWLPAVRLACMAMAVKSGERWFWSQLQNATVAVVAVWAWGCVQSCHRCSRRHAAALNVFDTWSFITIDGSWRHPFKSSVASWWWSQERSSR